MKKEDFKVKVVFNNKEYTFDNGSEAYIFHTGLWNNFHINHGIDELIDYVRYVHTCYVNDDKHTPLGAYADYIAERWEFVKKSGYQDMMQFFYTQVI